MRLTGQRALVTGGGRGLGRAIALALARAGADVAVAARTRGQLEATAAAIQALRRRTLALPVDLDRPESVAEAAATLLKSWGRLDCLVNNAGVFIAKRLVDLDVEDWDRTLDTNLRGAFLACRAFVPSMMAAGSGSIVNISSIYARVGEVGMTAQCASKFGLRGFTEALARELRPHGVRVNAIAPGAVDADGEAPRAGAPPPLLAKVYADDVAKLAVFLASDDARQITGASYEICGGTEVRIHTH